VPAAISSTVRQRLLFRLADAYEYGTFGLSTKAVPPLGPGRAVFAETGQLVQVARSRDLASAVDTLAASAPETGSRPAAVGTLPTTVSTSVLAGRTTVSRRPWFVALGLGEHDLAPAGLTVYEGEHVLVAGPARSGRSTALATIAGELAGARPDLETVVVAGPRSPLAGAGAVDGTVLDPGALTPLTALVDDAAGRPMLVLVDDAEAIDDPAGVLAGLLSTPRPGLLLAAAARNDVLRSAYSHWTRSVRRSKLGILLQPDVDLDGDLFGVALPRRAPVAMVAGRGYLVNGPDVQLVQVATRIEA
jgi:S-DNA-T family DNA segregation ATPase FtsK/SpoIIIE